MTHSDSLLTLSPFLLCAPSCNPNLLSINVYAENRSEVRMPRVALFASRSIEAGAELSMHYGYDGDKEFECACDWCKERQRAQSLVQHQTNRRIHSLARKKKIKLAEESARANPTPGVVLTSSEQPMAPIAEALSDSPPSPSAASIAEDSPDSSFALELSPFDPLSPVPVHSAAILDFCGPPGEEQYDDATSVFFGTADASAVDACTALEGPVSGSLSSHAGYLATLRSLVGPERLVPVTTDSCSCVLHLHPSRTTLAVFALQNFCTSFGNAGSVGWHEAQIELMRAHVQEQMHTAAVEPTTAELSADGDVPMPALEAAVDSASTAAATHTAPPLLSCTRCSDQFDDPLQLCAHRSEHVQLHLCRSCGKAFASAQRLRLHEAQAALHARLDASKNRSHHHDSEIDWFDSPAPPPIDRWAPRGPRKTTHHSSSHAVDESPEVEPWSSAMPDSVSPASAAALSAAPRQSSARKPPLQIGSDAHLLLLRFNSHLVRLIRFVDAAGITLTLVTSADLGVRVLGVGFGLWDRFCSSVEPCVTRLFARLTGRTVCRSTGVCLMLNLDGAQQAVRLFADADAQQWFSNVLEPALRGDSSAEHQWTQVDIAPPKPTPKSTPKPPSILQPKKDLSDADGIAFSDLRFHTLQFGSLDLSVIELPSSDRLLYSSDARRLFGISETRWWNKTSSLGMARTISIARGPSGRFTATTGRGRACISLAGVRALVEDYAAQRKVQPHKLAWIQTTLIPALSGGPIVKTEPAPQLQSEAASAEAMNDVRYEESAAAPSVPPRLSSEPMSLPSEFRVLSLCFTSSIVVHVLQFESTALVCAGDLSRVLQLEGGVERASYSALPSEHLYRVFARVQHNEIFPSSQTTVMLTLEGCRRLIHAHPRPHVAEWFEDMLLPACACDDEDDGAAAGAAAASSSENYDATIAESMSVDALHTMQYRSISVGVIDAPAGRLFYAPDAQRLFGIKERNPWRKAMASLSAGLTRRAPVLRAASGKLAVAGRMGYGLTAAGVRALMETFEAELHEDTRAWMEATLLPILDGQQPIPADNTANAQADDAGAKEMDDNGEPRAAVRWVPHRPSSLRKPPLHIGSDARFLLLLFNSKPVRLIRCVDADGIMLTLVASYDLGVRALGQEAATWERFCNSVDSCMTRLYARMRETTATPSTGICSMLNLDGAQQAVKLFGGADAREWFTSVLEPALRGESNAEHQWTQVDTTPKPKPALQPKKSRVAFNDLRFYTLRFDSVSLNVVELPPSAAPASSAALHPEDGSPAASSVRLLYGSDARRLFGIDQRKWRDSGLATLRPGLTRDIGVTQSARSSRLVATLGRGTTCYTLDGLQALMEEYAQHFNARKRAWMEKTLLPVLRGELSPENAQTEDAGADMDDDGEYPHCSAAASLSVVSALNSLGEHQIEATLARASSSAEHKQQVNPYKGQAFPASSAAASSASSAAAVPVSSLSQFLSPSSHVGKPMRSSLKPASTERKQPPQPRSVQQPTPPRTNRGRKRSASYAELAESESEWSAADDAPSGRSTPSSSASAAVAAVPRPVQQQLPPQSRRDWIMQHDADDDWADEEEDEMADESKAAPAAASSSSAVAAAPTAAASAAHLRRMRSLHAARSANSEFFPPSAAYVAAAFGSDDDDEAAESVGDEDEEEEYHEEENEDEDEDDAEASDAYSDASRHEERKRGSRLGLRSGSGGSLSRAQRAAEASPSSRVLRRSSGPPPNYTDSLPPEHPSRFSSRLAVALSPSRAAVPAAAAAASHASASATGLAATPSASGALPVTSTALPFAAPWQRFACPCGRSFLLEGDLVGHMQECSHISEDEQLGDSDDGGRGTRRRKN